jgi:pimeloyl-ACP methyl ester carboxylesterase
MTLVLLHPLPLDGSVWSEETRGLASHCIAPTLYDLGATIGDWAAGVLDLAGPGPLVLVGNSVGGSCAIEVAHRAPDRVRAIVLIGAKAGHRPEPEFRDRALAFLAAHGMAAAWDEYWAPLFAPNPDTDVVEHAKAIACAQPLDAVIRGVRVFHTRPDRAAFFASRAVPVFVVRGEYETIGRQHWSDTDAVIAGAGHYVPVERPAALTAVLRDRLAPYLR